MDHIDASNAKLKDLQDEFDVISHNLSTRMNYDADMHQALLSAKTSQKVASGFKAFVVIFMCAMQTYFITCILAQKQGDAATPYKGLSGKPGSKASGAASKDPQKQSAALDDSNVELV